MERSGDLLTFDVWARMEADMVPDRIQHLETYGAWIIVDYTVVGVHEGAITRGSHNYELFYEEGVEPDHPHASPDVQRVEIAGSPGLAGGFVGIEGFNLALNQDFVIYPGRYMRAVNVMVYDFDYRPADGIMTFYCDGYYSNSGLVSYELNNEFSIDFALIQVNDTPALVAGSLAGPADGAMTDLVIEESL